MVQEIIYTSAEKGLKQGSRGFCTVVSTAGMAINLAERLESMSGYRQAFPMGDPRASQNPVCYSHVTTRLAGRTLHVISRVADAGQDYSGRSNKLAHHIAIESVTGITAGPARILRQSGVIVEQWNGEVRHVAPRELPSMAVPTDVSLAAWKSATGDHGWAGVVAEQLTSSSAPVNVIFQPGTEVIVLVQEVIDLLPASQRWTVTFCTYFTRLLAGTECQLRFVLNDTPEAAALRTDAKARVIDLTKPLPAASGGNLVSKARNGIIRPDASSSENAQAFSELQVAARNRLSTIAPAPATRSSSRDGVTEAPGSNSTPPVWPFPDPFEPPRSSIGRWILIASTMVIVGGTAIAIALNAGSDPDKFSRIGFGSKNNDSETIDPSVEALRRKRDEERAAAEEKEKVRLALEEAERAAKLEADRLAQQKANDAAMAQSRNEAERKKAAEDRLNALKLEGPFTFIKASVAETDGIWHDEFGQWMFELPRPTAGARAEHPLPLRTLGADFTLRMFEGAKSVLSGPAIEIEIQKDANSLDTWNLNSKQGSLVSHLGTYRIERIDSNGDAAAADIKLHFEWAQEAQRESLASELARWWPIVITVGSEEATLLQRRAETPTVADQIPTWRHLIEKRPFAILNSDALEAINLSTCQNLRCMLQISEMATQPETKLVPQVVELRTTLPLEPEQQEQELQSERRFFPLSRPIRLQENRPAIDKIDPTHPGYGELVLTLRRTDQTLELIPELTTTVRLPNLSFLQQLPSIRLKQRLVDLKKDPTQFPRIAGSKANESWPEMKRSHEEAVQELRDTMAVFSHDFEHWHRQPLAPLESRKKFTSPFEDIAEDAVRKIKGVLPSLKKEVAAANSALQRYESRKDPLGQTHPDTLAGTYAANSGRLRDAANAADKAYRQAATYESAISEFQILLKELVAATEDSIETAMQDYDKINVTLDDWHRASEAGAFNVEFMIATESIPTPGAQNGEGIVLYFVKTNRQGWPITRP